MHEQTMTSLEQLAHDEPDIALLALLYRDGLASFEDQTWTGSNDGLTLGKPVGEIPALHEQVINLDIPTFQRLLLQMIETAGLPQQWPELPDTIRSIDLSEFARAVIEWDLEALDRLVDDPSLSPALLMSVGSCAILPQMHALHKSWHDNFSTNEWRSNYCPLCGSWPTIAEQRGLEKSIYLRCGRCFSEWPSRHQYCVFCGNDNHERLAYMAAEGERESRRVVTCKECSGYLKVLATVRPFSPGEVLRRDLESIELDLAASDEGYARPAQPGCSFSIRVSGIVTRDKSWLPWR
ncbi:MAG: formate dehydrogenase accessory protein FdhE [Sphaerobacteraceae bacterium]|nr:MAG: formate dehydrogenase accessory protein FdhE [Sphaerobacteraceae bacterium]